MPRSSVLRGLPVPRDRAQQRGRLDRARAREVEAEPPATKQLREWLSHAVPTRADIEEIEQLDLDGFLRSTAHIDLSAAERLRQLAIWLEEDVHISLYTTDRRAFCALERVYSLATRLDPRDARVLQSLALVAHRFADQVDDVESIVFYSRRAERAFFRALDLAPADAHTYYLLGYSIYNRATGSSAEALPWFEQALTHDPKHAFARLYLAHCLHDLARWSEAVEAYLAVDRSQLPGYTTRRGHKLLEQLAWCRLQTGDRARALEEFEAALSRYERVPTDDVVNLGELTEVACGVFRKELRERVLALFGRIGLTPDERLVRELPAS